LWQKYLDELGETDPENVYAGMYDIDDIVVELQRLNNELIAKHPDKHLATGSNYTHAGSIARLHEGEMVVPSSFAAAVRRGEITIGSGAHGTGNGNNYYINVEGSVISERDLVKSLSESIDTMQNRGYITH
jgi:hypothetical protein